MAEVDIVTTTYRSAKKLEICLNSVLERTKFVDYKWYLWANDPNDEIKNVIHESMFEDGICFQDKLEPIFNDTNEGSFSSNNNEAAAEGDSPYILFMNDDIEPLNEGWLYSMKSILDSDPKVGAVGALLFYPNRSVQHCGVFFSRKTNNLPFHMHYKQPIQKVASFVAVPRYYQAVTGACMLVRRKDFEKLGGFDEDFNYGYEDVALCLDLKNKLRKSCVFLPQAQLIHHEGISGKYKEHPNLQHNIKVFRKKYGGMYMDDLDFYLSNPKHMIYKVKNAQ